jgi:uroporphyrin-III C-methyltransferase / precorrin-2 dehydrogenase / sirohydrochlorin ferrochelatase
MSYLPIFADVRNQTCQVIGGGPVAARKLQMLTRYGARVTVIASEICAEIATMVANGSVTHHAREFEPRDLDTAFLAVAATDSQDVNREVSRLARARGILVNVVDQPALCTFILPSILDRAPVQIAVSTGGASPVLARLLRARLETLIPAAYGRLAEVMASYRDRAKTRFPDTRTRRRFWEQVLHGPIAELLFTGQDRAAHAALDAAFAEQNPTPVQGEVYLVGAGPGDPDLLTFRALRLMQQAEVVVYDRLVAPAILDLVRRDAERIYVGKQTRQHTLPQQDINRLLVDLARQGQRVLRLKGGDPFIFGRGGEEIATLSAEKISFQVVPGITAAAGCASYAGIPLTHRDYAQACLFVTGHLKDGRMELDWEALVRPRQTVAIYMGLLALEQLCAGLIAHGLAPSMPAALIQQGTTPQQRVVVATVGTLVERVQAEHIQAPTLIIIGEVVKLREQLAWFETKRGL